MREGVGVGVAAVCPGSFDPVTFGHLDVFARAAALFDRVVVAVLENPGKRPTFTVEERMALIADETGHLPGVEVDRFDGLLVDFCRDRDVQVVCKGLRGVTDFDAEVRMAEMNRSIGGVDTLFLPTAPRYGHLSSSLVREVAGFGGPVDHAVPPTVERALRDRLA